MYALVIAAICGAVCQQQAAHVQQVQQVVAAQVAVTPFAIPVATPVAAIQNPSLFYSYNSNAYGEGNYGGYAAQGAGVSWEDRMAARVAEKVLGRISQAGSIQASATLLSKNCASCHSGNEAKGGFHVDTPLSDAGRLKAITRILADDPVKRMPKGKTLAADELGRLIQEISRPQAAGEGAQKIPASPSGPLTPPLPPLPSGNY